MPDKKQDLIDQNLQDLNNDGVDRRGFLKCMAWAGTGLVWTMSGGIPVSRAFAKNSKKDAMQRRGLQLCADQRQPHRLQQAGQSGCYCDSADCHQQDQCACHTHRTSSFTPAI